MGIHVKPQPHLSIKMTKLPSKELLQRQLHKGLEAARQRWENCPED